MYVFTASLIFLMAVAPSVFGRLGGDDFNSVQGGNQQDFIADRTLEVDEATWSEWECADLNGIPGNTTVEGWTVCCSEECGECGDAAGCRDLPGGEYSCCESEILTVHIACIHLLEAPCVLVNGAY